MLNKIINEVDLFIGSAGSGHALVGPQMPHGMVKLNPDTITLPCGGYDYNDKKIIGFSHTHLEGVGGSGGRGNILITATTGQLKIDEKQYASHFSHKNESAMIGYYQVKLLDYNVNVELTASEHTGLHRYTFPAAKDAYILVDIGHTLGRWNNCKDGYIEIIDENTIHGYGIYPISPSSTSTFTVFFYIVFDKPFRSYGTWEGNTIHQGYKKGQGKKTGACLGYEVEDGDQVTVKVGLSYISVDQAKYNLHREMPSWNFEEAVNRVQQTWENILRRVEAKGGSKDQRKQFYSALYRSLNQPTDYAEYGKFQSGYSGESKVYDSEHYQFYGDDWAIWDTFRTTHPLQTIVEPERQISVGQSFAWISQHGGWLPMATAPNIGYNQTMIGHNAASVITDIYSKGFTDFDVESSFVAMKKTGLEQHENPNLRRLGTPMLYKELGYYPGGDEETEEDVFSVSLTLEFVYADWCTAQMAKWLGKEDEYKYFINRAYNYHNLFDIDKGFMRQRHRDGTWVEPFNPADSFKNGFCECSSWEYTFFVPHDIQGLMNLIGGREFFIKKLDDFFNGGHYNYQNETSIQVPYLYNYAGAPWKTQHVVRKYLSEKCTSKPDGLFGEDDAGAMSALYVFSAMGFYPVCPGQGVYAIGSPVFEEVVLKVGDNKRFIIKACQASTDNIYIQAAQLNGQVYNKSWITHQDIVNGGVLEFVMGPEPNKEWAISPQAAPPSMTVETPDLICKEGVVHSTDIVSGEAFTITCVVENKGVYGGETVKVYADNVCIGSDLVFLQPGEIKEINIECMLFQTGIYTLTINNLKIVSITVVEADKPCKYDHNIKLSKDMIPYGSKELIQATIGVQNMGSHIRNETVKLYINDNEVTAEDVCLAPGEVKKVMFSFALTDPGNHRIRIGESSISEVDVAIFPKEPWAVLSTTRAEFYQQGERLYINAAGYQGRPEFGIIYFKEKITGDFDVLTKVIKEDNSSPYSPAGILVANDIARLDELKACVILGAMSKRGYFFNCNTAIDNYYVHPKYAVGCPEAPYWFKLEKRGNSFTGYYSTNGEDWIKHNSAIVPIAQKDQYVGLFVNSASPELRMVVFDLFRIYKK